MHHVWALDRPFGGIDGLYVPHPLVIERRFPIGSLEKLQMRPLILNGAAGEGETQLRQEIGEDEFRQYREQLDEIQESVRRNIKRTERLQIQVDYLQKEEKLKGVISPEIKLIFPMIGIPLRITPSLMNDLWCSKLRSRVYNLKNHCVQLS